MQTIHKRRQVPLRLFATAFAAAAALCIFLHTAPKAFTFSQRRQTAPTGEEPEGDNDGNFETNESGVSKQFRLPRDTLAKRQFVTQIDEQDRFLASPSILELPSGRLLVLFEKQPSWGHRSADQHQKPLYASDDGGDTWEHIASPGPLQWPQIFSCTSGTYIIGCERAFSVNNNLMITRMVPGSEGREWSVPTKLSTGWSVITINTGVDVSAGRVTKAFEMVPSMASPIKASVLAAPLRVNISMSEDLLSWHNPPRVTAIVQDAAGFIANTLVKVNHNDRALFFRVVAVDAATNSVQLRLQRFTLFWQTVDVELPAGAELTVGSNANVYGGVDWVSCGMSADETADLTNPLAWTFSSPLGNPASMHSNEVRLLFDAAFRADQHVRQSITGFGFNLPADGGKDMPYEAGLGSLYWMEGVVVRLQDRRGSSGRLLNILRINNDLFCDLAAITLFDDSQPGKLTARFLRYKNVPGLAVGHPAIVYDNVTDIYWMTSNINRDSLRRWKQPHATSKGNPTLHITPYSKCEVDRTTMGLFYSGNGFDWHQAGILDYHSESFGRHFTYPHMIISGEDLLVVMRATASSGQLERTANYYNNHNSNAISFHRIRGFRRFANVEWVTFEGEYSQRPRIMSNHAEDW